MQQTLSMPWTEYNTESSGDDYGDDFELEEGMEQSDTNIDVAKVTEANEFNSDSHRS